MHRPHLISDPGNARDQVRRYGLALLAAIVALLLRKLLAPLLGDNNPYHTVWVAVVVSAWYFGLWPSIVATLVGVVGVWYWFIPPAGSFELKEPKSAISGMIGFLFFSGLIIALGESNRRSIAKSRWAEEQLRKAHGDLEWKVAERTRDLNAANESLRELSGRLQQMRDEERRQIARELHDSVGQLLVALNMNIAVVQLQANKLDAEGARAVSENAMMIEQISSEVRTISYLLHPPLLDVAGLASALRWYVDGFSERSKIQVDLDITTELGRLSDEMEIAIFRMVQECLTNIHRHSGGTSAVIRVREEDHDLFIEVQDSGKGISPERQSELSSSSRTGVGFRGMRERLRQLGGALEIRSDGTGTTVRATLPLELAATKPAQPRAN
ncbi:MAG: ATP-binding protein [Candidatus Sulfotelmatobacter sp.]|jgi:signal transduction histidine kinase